MLRLHCIVLQFSKEAALCFWHTVGHLQQYFAANESLPWICRRFWHRCWADWHPSGGKTAPVWSTCETLLALSYPPAIQPSPRSCMGLNVWLVIILCIFMDLKVAKPEICACLFILDRSGATTCFLCDLRHRILTSSGQTYKWEACIEPNFPVPQSLPTLAINVSHYSICFQWGHQIAFKPLSTVPRRPFFCWPMLTYVLPTLMHL